MTSGPDQPYQPPDPYAPVDYPADVGLPPPVYPAPYPGPPYPGAHGYPTYGYLGDPYDPYHPQKPPGTNGKAIAALVSALAGVLCCGLSSIAAVILGTMGLRETRRTGQDGFGIALAGTVIGGLVVVGWLLYWVVMIGVVASSSRYSP